MRMLRDTAGNLWAAGALAFMMPVRREDFRCSASQVLVMLLSFSGLVVLGQYLALGPGVQFSNYGFLTLSVHVLLILAICVLAWQLQATRNALLPLLVVFSAVAVLFAIPNALIETLPMNGSDGDWSVRDSYWFLFTAWEILVLWRALTLFYAGSIPRKLAGAVIYLTLLLAAGYGLPQFDFWYPFQDEDEAQTAEAEDSEAVWAPYREIDAEAVFYRQHQLLDQAAAGLAPQRPGLVDLYFLGFGSHAYQDVFMKEVMSVRQLFDQRFDSADRSLALVNNLATVDSLPLASGHNLARSLDAIAESMDREEDLLFLFLTSHGSQDHYLSVDFWPLPLNHLGGREIREALDAAGIKWRVIVVSACFSGGFIDALAEAHSLILTAARSDRNSFGCDHLNDFTYFGEAYFDQALRKEMSFTLAFEQAKAALAARETAEGLTPSEPQIYEGAAIAEKLAAFETRLKALQAQANSRDREDPQ